MLPLTADSPDLLAIINQEGKYETSREGAKPRRREKQNIFSFSFLRAFAASREK
jgi:hypothetical protein